MGMMLIGILAIHGSVREHEEVLKKLGVETRAVRNVSDLEEIDGIILPGGESTTQSKLLKRFGIFDPLKKKIEKGIPVWGTCAGAILLAKKVYGKNPPETLGVMDIQVDRNFYGSQLASFIAPIELHLEEKTVPMECIFIRAPKLQSKSPSVQILASYEGSPVILRQKNMLATAFHPELTGDTSVHEYFLSMCQK